MRTGRKSQNQHCKVHSCQEDSPQEGKDTLQFFHIHPFRRIGEIQLSEYLRYSKTADQNYRVYYNSSRACGEEKSLRILVSRRNYLV